MALELIYPYTGTIPKSGGLTVEEEIAACIAFRDWEYTELAVKLTNNTPELNKVIDFANELFSSSLFLGEYNPATAYAQKESVSVGDDIFLSKIDGNVTTPPSASWVMIPKSVRTDNTNQDIDGVKNFLNMPTIVGDLLIESGSNANGNWLKYSDGTLICYHSSTTTYLTSSAIGAGFRNTSIPYTAYPITFVGVAPMITLSGATGTVNAWGVPGSSTQSGFNHTAGSFVSSGVYVPAYGAVGRWK